jgi:hypothetical protein
MKNLKLQLMALGLITTSLDMLAIGDWFRNTANKTVNWTNSNVVQPIQRGVEGNVQTAVATFNAAKDAPGQWISDQIQPAADALATGRSAVTQAVNGMKDAVNQVNSVIAQIQDVQSQVASNAEKAQQLWGAGAPTMIGAFREIKAVPQLAAAVGALQKGAEAIANAAGTAAVGLGEVKRGTDLVRGGLGYVSKGTNPMRTVGQTIGTVGGKLHDAAGKVNIKALENIADSIGNIGLQLAEIAGVIDAFTLSFGKMLSIVDNMAQQTGTTFTRVDEGARGIAKA